MKAKLPLTAAALALLITLPAPFSICFAQGVLTPPGAPAPTMKSLDQIEARTPITNTASLVIITQPGSYYLTHNLTVSSGDGIDINVSGVTLDLNGFTISSTVASATGSGILLGSALSDLTICNGHIRGSVTNNGSGVYGGGGFGNGIYYNGSSPVNILVSRVSVSRCLFSGIYLSTGDATVVEACTVHTAGSDGIVASTLKNCAAVDCGNVAIYGDEVSDCQGRCSGGGDGLYANYVAQNCYGQSSTGNGLATTTAQNCYGEGDGGGYGLDADTAQNCYGYSASGFGLESETAIGCYGYSSSSTGLSAFIANVCHGATYRGTALSVTHNIYSY